MNSNCLYSSATTTLYDLGDGILEMCFDRACESINKLDGKCVADLHAALAVVRAHKGARGLLITSAKEGFIAGADIEEFIPILVARDRARLATYIGAAADAISALANLSIPSVAAIDGAARGGGLELGLAADFRILATSAQVGLPEVGLGIVPGVGGTARLPRIAGGGVALEWIVGARTYRAPDALAAGVADGVVESDQLQNAAHQWLLDAIEGKHDWQGRRARHSGSFTLDPQALARVREQAVRAGPHLPAGRVAVDLIEMAAPAHIEDALALEMRAFIDLAGSPAAASLMMQFLSTKELRRKSKLLAARGKPVKRAAVLGAGIMGGGIACVSAVSGVPIVMKDIAQGALDSGLNEARKLMAKQVSAGRLTRKKADALYRSIEPTLEMKGFDDVDIVIEAVIEKMDVKQKLLSQVEGLVHPGTVLASNTSSLSISDMAVPLARTSDFVGMHFFNPVPVMPLVEIVRGTGSSDEAVGTAVAYVSTLGKVPIVVKDCPGFLVNRLLGAYLFAFMRVIRDGADFAQVDRAMEAFGWPMGPAYLQDVVGIDTLDKALAGIAAGYPRMKPEFETAVQLLARTGRFGQKNGKGYYRYEPDEKGKPRRFDDPEIGGVLDPIRAGNKLAIPDEEIVDRLMLPMVIEASHCLDENVAEGAMEIDAAMLLGAGFPRHLGGPLWHADRVGLAEVVRKSQALASHGALYVAGRGLTERAAKGAFFYQLGNDADLPRRVDGWAGQQT